MLECNNIGYNIRIPLSVAQRLPGIGATVKIYTYTSVREDAFNLFGFLSKDDLEIYKKLIAVNGIGPKGALSILSAMSAEDLRFAILSGDVKAISKAQGSEVRGTDYFGTAGQSAAHGQRGSGTRCYGCGCANPKQCEK